MAIQPSTNGHSMPTISNLSTDQSSEAVIQTILPQVLEAVGNGYNHVEGRLNEVQNKRLPSLEAQIRAFEQSQAQIKGTKTQLSDLKERLDAAETKEAFLETLSNKFSESIRKLETNKSALTSDAARVQALSSKVDQLQADSNANKKAAQDAAKKLRNLPPDGNVDWASVATVLDSVKELSETVKKFQGEKEADARKIQTLSETVSRLQADRQADADGIQAQSERLDKLQKQQTDGEQATRLDTLSHDVEKLQTDRTSDASRIQSTVENLNRLQSQQAEKANRTSLNVLTEKVAKLQADDQNRTSDADIGHKQCRKLEERMEKVEKQFKNLDDQPRKVETTQSDIATIKTATSALAMKVAKIENRQSDASNSNTTNSVFTRLDKLENRDASVAKVNADAQALLKRVQKLTGEQSELAGMRGNLQTLAGRVLKLEGPESDAAKAIADTKALLKRLDELGGDQSIMARIDGSLRTLVDRVKKLEGPVTDADGTAEHVKNMLQEHIKEEVRRLGEVTSQLRELKAHMQEKTQPPSLSTDDLARTLIQRLSEGEVFNEETKSLIRVATGDAAAHRGTKISDNSDRSARSLSTTSTDVLSGNQAIEKTTLPRHVQRQEKDVGGERQLSIPSIEMDEDQPFGHQQSAGLGTSNKPSIKRKFDVSSRDNNNAEQATAGSRKRSKSAAGTARATRRATEEQQSRPKRQKPNGRHAASSPVDKSRPANRGKQTTRDVGSTDDDRDEEESDEETAPRRTSRTVRPTQKGSHLTFLDGSTRRNS